MSENEKNLNCGCGDNGGCNGHGDDHDCGCNGHDEEYACECHDNLQKITLTLDDGTDMECIVLGIFGVEDKEYIALVGEDEERAMIYEYEDLEDEMKLSNIEDDAEFDMVAEVFETLFGGEEE